MSQEQNVPVNKKAAINQAIAQIKSKLTAVKKDEVNPHFKNSFASLNAHLKLVEPLIEEAGCFLTQSIAVDPRIGKNVLVTKLTHVESGQIEESFVSLPDLTDMQKLGSAITYARRYTLGSLFAMQAEDDDGNMASGKNVASNKGKVTKRGDF